jgi:hypothetical protein
MNLHKSILLWIVLGTTASTALAREKPVVGLIPKVQRPMAMDGRLTGPRHQTSPKALRGP